MALWLPTSTDPRRDTQWHRQCRCQGHSHSGIADLTSCHMSTPTPALVTIELSRAKSQIMHNGHGRLGGQREAAQWLNGRRSSRDGRHGRRSSRTGGQLPINPIQGCDSLGPLCPPLAIVHCFCVTTSLNKYNDSCKSLATVHMTTPFLIFCKLESDLLIFKK